MFNIIMFPGKLNIKHCQKLTPPGGATCTSWLQSHHVAGHLKAAAGARLSRYQVAGTRWRCSLRYRVLLFRCFGPNYVNHHPASTPNMWRIALMSTLAFCETFQKVAVENRAFEVKLYRGGPFQDAVLL